MFLFPKPDNEDLEKQSKNMVTMHLEFNLNQFILTICLIVMMMVNFVLQNRIQLLLKDKDDKCFGPNI